MRETVNIHATCVRLGRAGVLLLGKSGAGKSDLALRLIGRGAKLVADDRADLFVRGGRLVAQSPANIAGLIELRGVGIVGMPYAASATIALVVDLSAKVKRMPEPEHYKPPHPLTLARAARPRLLALSAFEASAPDKIVAVLTTRNHERLRGAVKSN